MSARPNASGEEDLPLTEYGLLLCIHRLHDLIAAETDALTRPGPIDFEAFNQRKSHALVEFMQFRQRAPAEGRTHVREPIEALRGALHRNAEALELRLRATQEIATLLIDRILEEELDGTYRKHGALR